MERIQHIEIAQQPWTFDTVRTGSKVASIREPLRLTTESGIVYTPATIQYFQSESDEDRYSPLLKTRFSKKIFEYSKGAEHEDHVLVQGNVLYDVVSGLKVLGIPIRDDSTILSASERFSETRDGSSRVGPLLRRLSQHFPDIDFGLFGSWALDMAKPESDIDLYVCGGDQFQRVFNGLHDVPTQMTTGIKPLSDQELIKYARRYEESFNINSAQALELARLRNRFVGNIGKDQKIRIGLSSVIPVAEYSGKSILGSEFVEPIEINTTLINAGHSSSFPRVYEIDYNGTAVDVLTIHWTLRRLARSGDRVLVKGSLRRKNDHHFISLEKPADVLLRVQSSSSYSLPSK